mgnify:CR=1 FL=1
MIRRPPRSTLDRSSAASDVYKRQQQQHLIFPGPVLRAVDDLAGKGRGGNLVGDEADGRRPVSYTHLTLPTSDLV